MNATGSKNATDEWVSALRENPSSLEELGRLAAPWLKAPAISVTGKKRMAPSGDPHDYASLATYWWPDPKDPTGKSYVRRDGEPNPEFFEYDAPALEALCTAVNYLVFYALAADSIGHAEQAGRLLRGWFLDPATCMNPNLNHAGMIPGVTDGQGIGIIDTTSLIFLVQAAGHLPFNAEWTPEHLAGLKSWFSQYLDWLLESPLGCEERDRSNNHGSWYDAQVVSFALFCGRPEVARQQILTYAIPRVLQQISPDGSQPRELERTLSLTYCTYNALAFASVAEGARNLGIDLWSESGPAHGRLVKALDWLAPYYAGRQEWNGKQIHPFDSSSAALLLYAAWHGTQEPRFLELCKQLEKHPWQRFLFSKAALTGRPYPFDKYQRSGNQIGP